MSRFQDVVQQGIRADQPVATDVSVGTLYGVTDEGDIIERSDGAAWQPYSPGAGQSVVVQVVNTQTGASTTTTVAIPGDDTIPQNTEGKEVMTLAITPTSATNKLKIDVVVELSHSVINQFMVAALFQDTTADALAVQSTISGAADGMCEIAYSHYMTAGTTSSTTFKVRVGGSTGATTTFNGASGARLYGGVYASSITISEIVP